MVEMVIMPEPYSYWPSFDVESVPHLRLVMSSMPPKNPSLMRSKAAFSTGSECIFGAAMWMLRMKCAYMSMFVVCLLTLNSLAYSSWHRPTWISREMGFHFLLKLNAIAFPRRRTLPLYGLNFPEYSRENEYWEASLSGNRSLHASSAMVDMGRCYREYFFL